MMEYIKIPVPVEAFQWFELSEDKYAVKEIDYVKFPFMFKKLGCNKCNGIIKSHGLCQIKKDVKKLVCPGDWIIEEPEGGFSVLKPDEFNKTYKLVK